MQENNHLKQLQDYRQELENEKESLRKIQKIIQKQINALDIERLHLESVAKGPATKNTTITDIDKTNENDDDELNPLDLNVPNMIEDNEEEEEDDESL